MRVIAALLPVCFIAACGAADLRATDVEGAEHRLTGPGRKATVLIFSSHECPISNSYAPQINELCETYARRGVEFYVVQVDPDLSREQARQHAADYGYRCPVLLDPQHVLVNRVRATTTPEAAMLSPNGRLLYLGRIDDRYVDLGKRRAQPTVRDLREAIEAVLDGEPVPNSTTVAVGCPIPSLKD